MSTLAIANSYLYFNLTRSLYITYCFKVVAFILFIIWNNSFFRYFHNFFCTLLNPSEISLMLLFYSVADSVFSENLL